MKKLVIALLLASSPAHAQSSDIDLDRGPTAELYIRKRPPAPESPSLSPELQKLLTEAAEKRDAKREEAIKLLRAFLAGEPEGETKAQGLFKLAELLWEDARRVFLEKVDEFERAEEKCKQKRCKKAPKEPTIDLSESESLYKQLLAEFPDFDRRDLVLYLVGFAARQDNREEEALAMFDEVIKKHPDSPLYGDSWMMIGEHYFAAEKWPEARAAYAQILTREDAATYNLALFKTAWCDWKLGDIDLATDELKQLLGITKAGEEGGTATERRQLIDLREQAFEYLVIIFTEDRSISAKEIYDFLASVGDETYSRDVLIRVAEAYYGQSEYERSADTYKFLIGLESDSLSAAKYQRKIVENWVSALDGEMARKEMKILVDDFGPGSKWARHQRGEEDALDKSITLTEKLVRTTADNMNAEAQRAEERAKGKVDKHIKELYEHAADAYGIYLAGFGDTEESVQVRYHLADILYFTLEKYEEAGDQYLMVGKSAPVGDLHKPALKQAMDSFEKARPKDTSGRKQMYPVDKKFGEAMDLYATLFKDDKEVVPLIFKYGQLFYDYGDYDEAIKRFGLIIEEFPDDPNALAAGDRILKALEQGKDYENIETWARRLKKTQAFKDPKEQATLDKYIVDAIRKSGDTYKDAGKYEQAAGFYLRIPKEFPKHDDAPQAMRNAGVMYVKAKKPEEAAEIYLDLAERYPKDKNAQSSAFDAALLYEGVAYFDRAAEAYELYYQQFPGGTDAAVALYNAGRLRQSLAQYDKAIAHYQTYAKKFPKEKDASGVAFKIGVVYEESGDDGRADQAFRDFIKKHKGDKRVLEAYVRAGRASIRLGQLKRAADLLEAALKIYKKEKNQPKQWAAEARYWQGELLFREYEKISLDVKPSALDRTLKKKTDMLVKAQEVYGSVVAYKDFRWATAALYRVGNVYEQYANSLRNAPTPKDLTPDEEEAYRGALDMAVVDIEEKAIELYSTGYQRAIEMQVYDEYTTKIREALGRMAPDEYPPEREGRADERIGDRPVEIKLIREVNR